jgi:hypothetical protein
VQFVSFVAKRHDFDRKRKKALCSSLVRLHYFKGQTGFYYCDNPAGRQAHPQKWQRALFYVKTAQTAV